MIVVSRKAYDSLKKRLSEEDLAKLIPSDIYSLSLENVCKKLKVSKMTLLKRIDELKRKGFAFKFGKGKTAPWKLKKETIEYLGHIPDGRGAHWAEKRGEK